MERNAGIAQIVPLTEGDNEGKRLAAAIAAIDYSSINIDQNSYLWNALLAHIYKNIPQLYSISQFHRIHDSFSQRLDYELYRKNIDYINALLLKAEAFLKSGDNSERKKAVSHCKAMFSRRIGLKSAELYQLWARYYEMRGDTRKAENIYKKGGRHCNGFNLSSPNTLKNDSGAADNDDDSDSDSYSDSVSDNDSENNAADINGGSSIAFGPPMRVIVSSAAKDISPTTITKEMSSHTLSSTHITAAAVTTSATTMTTTTAATTTVAVPPASMSMSVSIPATPIASLPPSSSNSNTGMPAPMTSSRRRSSVATSEVSTLNLNHSHSLNPKSTPMPSSSLSRGRFMMALQPPITPHSALRKISTQQTKKRKLSSMMGNGPSLQSLKENIDSEPTNSIISRYPSETPTATVVPIDSGLSVSKIHPRAHKQTQPQSHSHHPTPNTNTNTNTRAMGGGPTERSKKHTAPPSHRNSVSRQHSSQSQSAEVSSSSVSQSTAKHHHSSGSSSSSGGMSKMLVNGKKYIMLDEIGRGGSSRVYKVLSDSKQIYAVKYVRLRANDAFGLNNYRNEIALLQKLRNKAHIIQMADYSEMTSDGRAVVVSSSGKSSGDVNTILMVFEFGEIDLAHLLKRKKGGFESDEVMIKAYWKQMLSAVQTIHTERIVHGDLKPANFLMVKGALKLIDFGIAKAIESNETTNIYRDSQIGTLNYMSPEAITEHQDGVHQFKLGRSADIWSLGCILHQICHGKTPFSHLKPIAKLHAITDRKHQIAIQSHSNPHINRIIQQSLLRNPSQRPTLDQLLTDPFLVAKSISVDSLRRFFDANAHTHHFPIPSNALLQSLSHFVNSSQR